MHVLHRPHFPGAIAAAAIAAALAIILTLALASGLSDQASAPGPAPASTPAAGLRASATRAYPSTSAFTRGPFSSLLTAPAAAPWAQNSR